MAKLVSWLPDPDPGPVKWTGLAVMVVAALRLVLQLLSLSAITALFGLGAFEAGHTAIFALLVGLLFIGSLVPIALFAVTAWGGWNAFTMRSWPWALTGFVFALVPLGGCIAIEIPLGLLGLCFTVNGEELFEAKRLERG